MSEKKETFGSECGGGIGCAAIILALCIGIGGCEYLQRKGEADVLKAKIELEKLSTPNRDAR